jgi:UDP-GlcNAc:undecaprenyl-phosphate/decaprenyl-phosphate GlcNAc-1-phosphate transferase
MLGFCVAILGLDFWRSHDATGSPFVFPILVALLPLLDTLLAVVRRLRNHASPLQGDRSHFYDLLLARGLSPRKVAFSCYGITIGCLLLGLLTLRADFMHALWISALSAGVLLFAALRLGSLGRNEVRPQMQRAKF